MVANILKCPKCKKPGIYLGVIPGKRGNTHYYKCENCKHEYGKRKDSFNRDHTFTVVSSPFAERKHVAKRFKFGDKTTKRIGNKSVQSLH